MWKRLVHIRESEVYLNTGEKLYNVIAVYIITVLIKTSAKFESHYSLSASFKILLSRPFFLSKFQNNIQVLAFEAVC